MNWWELVLGWVPKFWDFCPSARVWGGLDSVSSLSCLLIIRLSINGRKTQSLCVIGWKPIREWMNLWELCFFDLSAATHYSISALQDKKPDDMLQIIVILQILKTTNALTNFTYIFNKHQILCHILKNPLT